MNIQFSPPFIDEEVIDELVSTLKSGWLTTGPKVKALEDSIKMFCGAREVLCVNSWTSGCIMILRWLGVKEGDEVIVPAYTYAATALAVLHAGAKPVIVDTCAEDFNISVKAIEKAITPRTKAVIPVDIAGFPCDYDKIYDVVERKKGEFVAESDVQKKLGRVMVLSDAAHSLGGKYGGKMVGSNADVVIFSLHAVKNITSAEGGAICLNMPEEFDNTQLYTHLRQMSLNFQTKDAFTKTKAGAWEYDIIGMGMKCNMADVNACIALAQMRKYDRLLASRKRVFERYNEAFAKYDWAVVPPQYKEGKETSYHLYALRLKDNGEEYRNGMIEKISHCGVAVNVHFKPLPMLSYFKELGYDVKNCPQAFDNYQREISLPIYPQLTDEQVDYVIETVIGAYI